MFLFAILLSFHVTYQFINSIVHFRANFQLNAFLDHGNDLVDEFVTNYSVSHSSVSQDLLYHSMDIDETRVTVLDNDVAIIRLSKHLLNTSEGGADDS